MFVHHVLRTRAGRPLFSEAVVADELWRALRRAFPHALAVCLMPNHFHLLDNTDDPRHDHDRLVHIAGACARRLGESRIWSPSPMPEPVAPDKLLRVVRYIHLNAPRGHLGDLLSYLYCTHRGVIGAEHDPWVSAARAARTLGRSECGFAESFHDYVSSDPSVSPHGSPFPRPAPPRDCAAVPLADVLAAAHAGTYWCPPRVERHAVVLLGVDQGWPISVLASVLGIHRDSARRLARRPDAALLAAARLCLGDPRLRAGLPSAMPCRGRLSR